MAAVALTFVMAIGALAGTRAPANIPFDFEFRGLTMPAGRYTFESGYGAGVLLVIDGAGRTHAALGAPLGNPNVTAPSKVVFHFDGERYRLAEVWLSGVGGKQINYKPRVPAVTSKASPPRRIEIAIPG
ncbi:MAG: hypothetical protein C0506_16960 [Anaerolinea sp.]|nr:hypothetical protein [Anaerolinea sp.]